MNRKDKRNTSAGGFEIHLLSFILFLVAVFLINFIDVLWLKSISLIAFFFIPGYILMNSVTLNNDYNIMELLLLSFGLSIIMIITTTYVLIRYNSLNSITILLLLITSILFTRTSFRMKTTNSFKFYQIKRTLKQSWKNITLKIMLEDKYLIFSILLTVFFFFVGFLLRNYDIFRMPDEYYYLWASNTKILTNLNYRNFDYLDIHFIRSSTLKLGFILILSFCNELTNMTGMAPHIVTMVFYSMLLPVTYLIGSIHDKKTGAIAALFIASNPIIWFWNNRIMPDIIHAVFASACFYFFYKSFRKRGIINWYYIVPSILFGILSYVIEPKIIFVFGIPFIIYILTIEGKHRIFSKIFIGAIVISLFVFIVQFNSPWFFQNDFPKIMNGLFSIFNFNLQNWIEFISPQGVIWNSWLYPYYYSHAISILTLIGIFCFVFKYNKRDGFLTIFSIVMTLYLHSTVFNSQDARFSFLIFPILMVLAAIGLTTNLRFYSIYLVPLFVFLYPLLPKNEPAIGSFLQVIDLLRIISRLTAITILLYKILEGILSNLHTLHSISLEGVGVPYKSNLLEIIMVILIFSTSLSIGNSIVTDSEYMRSDYVNPNDVGLPQAALWVTKNVPLNSSIITNVRPHILSYYTNDTFDIRHADWRIDRPGIGEIIKPKDQKELLTFINNKSYDYMIVFSKKVVSEFWKSPYFTPYIREEDLFSIYSSAVEAPYIFTKFESTEGWKNIRGDVTISLESTDKKEGNHSIKVQSSLGITRTEYDPPGIWNLTKDVCDFWFKLDNATNPNYFSIIFYDNADNYRYWINDTNVFKDWDSGIWQKLHIAINEYSGQKGEFDLGQINGMLFYVYGDQNTTITYYLDHIQAYSNIKKIYSYQK